MSESLSTKSENDDETEKWSCEYCTYENFPSSLKCTMCMGQKPLLNEDIFRLSPSQQVSCSNIVESSSLNLSQSNLTACGSSNNQESPASKWTCSVCTFVNSVKCSRCAQCTVKRESDLDSSSHVQEQINALSIKDVDAELIAVNNRTSPLRSNSLSGSRTNLGAAGNRISPVDNKCYSTNKWPCSVCTYENWPKSLKCSMCGCPKDGSVNNTDRFGANTISSPERDIDENCAGNFIISNANKRNLSHHRYQLGSNEPINNCDSLQERRLRQIRRQADWQWLNACIGVVENNYGAVEAYLSCGGNPGRSLTSTEVALLNRNSAYDVGHTLIHLAIRFHREEMLPMLLAQISGGPGIKRVPSYVAPDLASDIRRHFATSLRVRKNMFNCHYITEHATFSLPAEIEELPISVQEQLYEELLDRDAQKQLESSPPALNWSLEITARLGSRLMVLWNRSAGDCLLDSVMQSTWGVFDRDNVLRRALADSLHQCGNIFYPRWKEYEMLQAAVLNYTLAETQWEIDWTTLLSLANQPGSSLEQIHIFALSHIMRRPIIVYGVKFVKSFRGEDIGYARFEGLYLPLLWEQSFCIKSPIALGYTRGHFSALVPTEPYSRIDAARDDSEDVTFLPLMDCEQKLLPIHFLTQNEMGREESIMRQWLDVCVTEGDLLVAQQKLHKRPLLVAQMLEEWLNHYRRIAQVMTAPFSRRPTVTGYSSDGDTDEE
ncbi:ubiquitin thioesterase trabid [Sitodiplosis mosellana]|uniref:ubiquitin thioesterase trabid n=1 Tax=Sitodiplosis mosellana TaxID=263140 RepID=UPI0024443022|nr:ubiquitin thioesterase trabid [Sitodiplosis mosellana]XP_055323332.1 ubiquitin thioesterase trabid [Sitodiplosis mosellana]XP_055323333.1 ubiquitin thioesterase trabid [Sitodiplosis mosellana]XP_055323334.1 ubiquitin thioesterase trabid [Sitodiplosis mosellana]XP_055323335.1 ubiquitin thioesterase trabid [Sitodiplosis mosellana]XP_055323336.1 ubiquitin thioesterase trabid [Sitodiplosis mosellana]XP_055323337.1 ubiquitin thioesterase trabid [Sitodiplosis mosellana]XP_055323338.1 ubiquitin 